MKFLILLIFIVVLWWVWRLKNNPSSINKQTSTVNESQKMVVCDYCGVYFPMNDAVTEDKKIFCSMEHLNLKNGR